MESAARIAVVIVAGGKGRRMGGSIPKQFAILGTKPILGHTIDLFARALPGAEIVVVLPSDQTDFWHDLQARFSIARHRVACGGEERFDSVLNGIAAISSDPDIIAVQDGVRPLGSIDLVRRTVDCAIANGSAIPVVMPVDSFRYEDGNGSRPVPRACLRVVQTPQVFRADILRNAYRVPFSPMFTDDASVVEASGIRVFTCEGERSNIKITTREDMAIAAALLDIQNTEE